MSLEAGHREARAIVLRSGSSFTWPMRLLTRRKRLAIYAVYAYARVLDDIADGDAPDAAKRQELALWRDEVEAIHAGRPTKPLGHALAAAVSDFGLRKAPFHDLVDGMEMDIGTPIRAPRREALALYCRRVAGATGLLCVGIFERMDPEGEAFALALGEALQLTNVLRDLAEDAARGRLYLPRELLAAHGLDADAPPEHLLADPRIASVCEALAADAETRFDEAARIAHRHPDGLAPALRMMAVYRLLLATIRGRGWSTFERVRPRRIDVMRALLRPPTT